MGLFKKTKETETRMNREEMLGAIRKIQGWKIVADFSVGGMDRFLEAVSIHVGCHFKSEIYDGGIILLQRCNDM